jgi:CRP-like cAMP-binding protein
MGNRRAGNRLIDALPGEDRDRLLSGAVEVPLERGQLLYERHEQVRTVYFPVSAVASLLVLLEDGGTVEMATIGREGLVGISVYLGDEPSQARAIAQIPGTAFRVDSYAFRSEVERSPALAGLLQRYTLALIGLMGQTVACNRMHTIEQRSARWLLMTQDRIDAAEVPLTQEFLAYMLGVRRQSVTEAAGRLQERDLIRYRRGTVTIVDREGLIRSACECYRVINLEFERLLPIPAGDAA